MGKVHLWSQQCLKLEASQLRPRCASKVGTTENMILGRPCRKPFKRDGSEEVFNTNMGTSYRNIIICIYICVYIYIFLLKHTRSATNWKCSDCRGIGHATHTQPTLHSLRIDFTWEFIGFSYVLSAETGQCLGYLKQISRERPRFANDIAIKNKPGFRYFCCLYISLMFDGHLPICTSSALLVNSAVQNRMYTTPWYPIVTTPFV